MSSTKPGRSTRFAAGTASSASPSAWRWARPACTPTISLLPPPRGRGGEGAAARAGGNGTAYRYQYLENDKCSSGTGENIQEIAGRFGLTIDEADELARAATGMIPITARCSVFAKSEMTHFANQGKPTADLLRRYFASVARNARALLARNQVDGPVYLIGGGARIASLRLALEEILGG